VYHTKENDHCWRTEIVETHRGLSFSAKYLSAKSTMIVDLQQGPQRFRLIEDGHLPQETGKET